MVLENIQNARRKVFLCYKLSEIIYLRSQIALLCYVTGKCFSNMK